MPAILLSALHRIFHRYLVTMRGLFLMIPILQRRTLMLREGKTLALVHRGRK